MSHFCHKSLILTNVISFLLVYRNKKFFIFTKKNSKFIEGPSDGVIEGIKLVTIERTENEFNRIFYACFSDFCL